MDRREPNHPDRQSLNNAFAHMMSIPFPKDSRCDQVSELHAELALYDTVIAGLVTTLIKVGRVPPEHESLLKPDSELRSRLLATVEESCAEGAADARAYLEYLDEIEAIVQLTVAVLSSNKD